MGSGGQWTPPRNAEAAKQSLPKMQLYDLDWDVAEQHNVYAEHPDAVQRLTAKIKKHISEGRCTPGTPQKNDVPVPLRLSK